MISDGLGEISPRTGEVAPSPRERKFWHGAAGLAKELDTKTRRAQYLLEKGLVPGAKKVCGRWSGLVARLPEIVAD